MFEFSPLSPFPFLNKIIIGIEQNINSKAQVLPTENDIKLEYSEISKFDIKRKYQFSQTQINKAIEHIQGDLSALPDLRNLCCLTQLYKNWRFLRTGQERRLLIVDKSQLIDEGEIEKLMCALLNEANGGMVFMGVSKD